MRFEAKGVFNYSGNLMTRFKSLICNKLSFQLHITDIIHKQMKLNHELHM